MSKQHLFDFALGEPLEGDVGRWVNGSVTCDDDGYSVEAHLYVRSRGSFGGQFVRLIVSRRFDADDFAAILREISTGRLQTATGKLELAKIEPSLEHAIRAAASNGPTEPLEQSSALAQDLAQLRGQFDGLRKRELIGRALAASRQPGMANISVGDPLDGRALR